MNDNELLARLRARDESVLRDIDLSCGRLICSVARNITGSQEDADEIKNDVLEKLWNSIPPSEPQSLMSFAAMISRRLALNRVGSRAAKKRGVSVPADELAEIASDGDISDGIEAKELGAEISRFLEGCPGIDREAFVRRYVFAEPPEVVAKRLGFTKNRLNVRLFRLRGKLREHLTEHGYIEDADLTVGGKELSHEKD